MTDTWKPIYINGVKRMGTVEGDQFPAGQFYADSDSLPHRRCSYHGIGPQAAYDIRQGYTIRTLGNTYSLHAPK